MGSSTGGVGTVNVEGEDSVLMTELFEIGSYGTGSLNITDKGYVTSSIVAIVGYQANSNGKVVVEKGGEWLIKNNDSSIEFQIGNQGTGEATIREGGLITAENTIIGGNATGIGTLNVQDQDSVITVRRLYNGYFGNGKVNISNNGLINNKEYSLVGVQDGSHGVVNVTDKGHWNFLGTGEAFRYIYIGDAGDGELRIIGLPYSVVVAAINLYQLASTRTPVTRLMNFRCALSAGDPESRVYHETSDGFFSKDQTVNFLQLFPRQRGAKITVVLPDYTECLQ